MKPYKIVVVDDEEESRNLTSRILRNAGYHVITAPSGLDGLVTIQAEQPDVVVLDVVMPDIDGLEICSLIKSDPLLKNTYILLLSGLKITSKSQAAGLEAGADDYITAPYSPQELLVRVRNLMALKTTRQALKAQLEEQRLASVGRLAAHMAHEINNYLAVITLYTDMMMADRLMPAKFKPPLNIVQEQSENAANLIAQILDFSRSAMIKMERVGLAAFLADSVAVVKEILPANIQIHLDTGDANPFLQADAGSLQKLVINLSLNAQDAMPDGGQLTFRLRNLSERPLHIKEPQTTTAERWVSLVVQDTGTGIKPEIIEKVFEPFFSTKHPTEGKGLGLAQVHGIVHQHGGTITVDSKINKGTAFTIYLPVETEPGATAVIADEPFHFEESDTSKGRILLIEENSSVRTALTEVLENAGYQIAAAGTASEGVAISRQRRGAFDLVISEYWLPDMQSSELLEILAAEFPTMKQVLVTDHLTRSDESFSNFQVDGLIGKPFNLDQVLSTIRSLINSADEGGQAE